MSAPKYDPSIIRQHATDLYARAARTVFIWTVIVGAVATLGAIALIFPKYPTGDPTRMGVLVLGVLGLMVGYMFGSSRAFAIRLQAQLALCQVAIEENTRNEKEPHSAAPSLEGIRPVDINGAS